MPTLAWNAIFPALFAEVGATFSYQDAMLSAPEAAKNFLPIVMDQALATSSVMGGLPGIRIETDLESLTGRQVRIDDAPACLLLPFVLDALLLARNVSQTEATQENDAIRMEHITPPILPACAFMQPDTSAPPMLQDMHQPE